MATNDGWETVTDPGEMHAYAAATLPAAPGRKKTSTVSTAPANPDMLETSKDRDTARSAMDLIGRIEPQLNRVRDLYNRNLKGAGPVTSLMEYLPSQANSQFDTAAAELQKLVRPATRTPGEGSMSDFESKLAMNATPNRYNFDASNEEAINGLQRFLDSNKAAYAKRLGLPAPPPEARKVSQPREFTIDRNGHLVQ